MPHIPILGHTTRPGIVVRDVEALGRTFPAARFWSHVPDRPEAERDEYLLVTLCEREGAPHVDIKLRDDGRGFRRRILAPPPAAVES